MFDMKPIISQNIRLRHPEHFQIGKGSIVDDFSYFSTKIRIGKYSHIASGCSIAGGIDFSFCIGDFSSLSSGVKIWCSSNDYVNDLVMINLPQVEMQIQSIEGDVVLSDYTGVGSNSVIMPNNHIPIGTVVGALSFVPPSFPMDPWTVYAGVPIRKIADRNRENVLLQILEIQKFLDKESS